MEEAIQSLNTPSKQADADEQRISSIASLNEQCARNQKRLTGLEAEITRHGRPAPNHLASLIAVRDLETLWEKMTTAERSRFMHTLIERIDHDPHLPVQNQSEESQRVLQDFS
jgi:hypothetical protein